MKRARTSSDAGPVEEHGSGFVAPMTLFDMFPHNDTFEGTHSLQLLANPTANNAEIYTFIHNRQDYGVMDTGDAKLSGKLRLHVTQGGAEPANGDNFCVNRRPFKYGWKTKAVYLNNQLITPQSSKENELEYVHDLLTTEPSDWADDTDITLGTCDTPGQFDTIANSHDGAAGNVNVRARARYVLLSQALEFQCIDNIDLLGHNKRYVPASFDMKVVLTRLEKTKMLLGTATTAATIDLCYNDFELKVPILKPTVQLSAAINELMIQKVEECRELVESEITGNELPENELMGYDDDEIVDENVKNKNPTENISTDSLYNVQKNEGDEINEIDDDDVNSAGLDERTIQTFLEQLIQLQNQTIIRKKESRPYT
ncbi:Hypothetical predicted protein [Paramuricea clavata]|uniref:Uncharacterized protein n=1 Tax=Paramuricea clavata TaxID=317549 RepID=A0A6S7K419_PARCT|nr:Hypothetical predicted protein [Paramuricea clavata]